MNKLVDVVRTLVRAQKDICFADTAAFLRKYRGPWQGVDYLLDMIWSENMVQRDEYTVLLGHALAVALNGPIDSVWVKKLVQYGADIHGRIRSSDVVDRVDICRWDEVAKKSTIAYGTPLDELFRYSSTPDQALVDVEAWLAILRDEGVDPKTYLEHEMFLHAEQQHLTYAEYNNSLMSRQLVFRFENWPTVTWRKLLDPEAPGYFGCREFMQMNEETATIWCGSLVHSDLSWDYIWPFYYPPWHLAHRQWHYHLGWKRLNELAWRRANRRLEKRERKANPNRDIHACESMPGAWPT